MPNSYTKDRAFQVVPYTLESGAVKYRIDMLYKMRGVMDKTWKESRHTVIADCRTEPGSLAAILNANYLCRRLALGESAQCGELCTADTSLIDVGVRTRLDGASGCLDLALAKLEATPIQ